MPRPCTHKAHWPPLPPLTSTSVSLQPKQGRAGGAQPSRRDPGWWLLPGMRKHLRRGPRANTEGGGHLASHPYHESLLTTSSPLHPKEQRLESPSDPNHTTYHLGDSGQVTMSLSQTTSQACQNLILVKICYGKLQILSHD